MLLGVIIKSRGHWRFFSTIPSLSNWKIRPLKFDCFQRLLIPMKFSKKHKKIKLTKILDFFLSLLFAQVLQRKEMRISSVLECIFFRLYFAMVVEEDLFYVCCIIEKHKQEFNLSWHIIKPFASMYGIILFLNILAS